MAKNSRPNHPPPLPAEAMKRAEEVGFDRSCSVETGRLLRVLSAGVQAGIVGEIGTGYGVGAAWIATSLPPDVDFVTIEIDAERVLGAQNLFERFPHVRVIHGGWRELLPYGPFALLFADAAAAKYDAPDMLLEALRPGGYLLLDDLTPGGLGTPDAVREFWLDNPRVAATEMQVNPEENVILAVRLT